MTDAAPMRDDAGTDSRRRQVLYWRLLARLFDGQEQPSLESASVAIVEDLGLPVALLDPSVSVDNIVQRHPSLQAEFEGVMAPPPDASDGDRDPVRTAALVSKVRLNAFGTGSGPVSATQLAQWQRDAGWLEQALGLMPGGLRAGRTSGDNPGLGQTLGELEADLVSRMHLREVLADPAL